MSTQLEYTTTVQELFLGAMLSDPQFFVRVSSILNTDNFDKTLRPTAEFIKEFYDSHSALPDPKIVKATTGIDLTIPEGTVSDGTVDWFLNEFESFTKRQELERAILKAADLLEKGEFDPVEKLIKDAVQISLLRDMGTDYFDNPQSRIDRYFNQGGQVSTGWPQLDKIMHGGFSRGELNIFAGGSGSGKSLVMMNIALNWLRMGLSGVYITLELSEELTSLRTDAMLTGSGTKKIRGNISDTAFEVKMAGAKCGKYRVKALPAQSNVNAIRAYLKEVQVQTGIKVDFVMVDYLDLVSPASVKVAASDQFIKDKYVSEELRNLAKELGVLMITASQLNRSAVEEIEFDHSHIAGGISKINTADNVFAIFTSRAMKERGEYQIQCMKSRSSTGVGQKIDLQYDIDSMRITDDGGNDSQGSAPSPASSVINRIKSTPTITRQESTIDSETGEVKYEGEDRIGRVRAEVENPRLQQMLNKIKSNKQ